jgi:hypothetical protein
VEKKESATLFSHLSKTSNPFTLNIETGLNALAKQQISCTMRCQKVLILLLTLNVVHAKRDDTNKVSDIIKKLGNDLEFDDYETDLLDDPDGSPGTKPTDTKFDGGQSVLM